MEPRLYECADRAACLALYAPDEQTALAAFLDSTPHAFFVLEHEGQILGCGGYREVEPGLVQLHWGRIGEAWRKQGLGRFLLLYRLRQIGQTSAERVIVESPRESAGFYLKQGFKPLEEKPGGTLLLTMRLRVCA